VADTIFALSSGRPPAAIAVIRISGPAAHDAARRIAGSLPGARTAARRRLRDPSSGALLDDGLLLRFDGPASSTGEDLVEVHCHGGRAVVDALLRTLSGIAGLRPANPGEFTRRAFENGRIDLTEAEGLADLLEAETESQRKAALALAGGGLRKLIAQWQEQLLGLCARAEHAIDYDEADDPIDTGLVEGCSGLAADLAHWLERPRAEPLKDGVLVVIAGPPNAGKSSLINAIAGEDRAIVSDIPGTTRDYIEVPLALDGVPVRLTDTAGLREGESPVEALGVERARRLVAGADILVWLGSPADVPAHPRAILVRSKADLNPPPCPADVSVSAVTGEGLAGLVAMILNHARSLLPAEDALALNRRQAAHLGEAAEALARAASGSDAVLVAEELRLAREAFQRLTGRAGVEEVLDALFGRFCLGK
jgi:tRNA modification GTPase